MIDLKFNVITIAIAAMSLTAAQADTFVSSGDSKSDLPPKLQTKQPQGGHCVYAGQVMKLGDSINLVSLGITQICVAGDKGPKLMTATKGA